MTTVSKRGWPRFTLRTLFAVVTIAAVASLAVHPLITWLYPPQPSIDELMEEIRTTVTANSSGPYPNDSPPSGPSWFTIHKHSLNATDGIMQTERAIDTEIQIGKDGSIYSGPPGPLIAGAIGLLVVSAVLLVLLFRTHKRD